MISEQNPWSTPSHRMALTRCSAVMLIASFLFPPALSAQQSTNDLFSGILMSDTASHSAAENRQKSPSRRSILGVVSLHDLLIREGIDSTVENNALRIPMSSLLKKLDGAAGSDLIATIDADQGRIDLFTNSDKAIDPQRLNSQHLISLFSQLERLGNIHLVRRANQWMLHTNLSNQDVTARRLRLAAEQLASAQNKIADNELSAQKLPTAAAKPTPKAQQADSSGKATASLNSNSILGTWSARTSATDAWAVRFESNQRFTLVHSRQSKRSDFERAPTGCKPDRLHLVGDDGVSLQGNLIRSIKQWIPLGQLSQPAKGRPASEAWRFGGSDRSLQLPITNSVSRTDHCRLRLG